MGTTKLKDTNGNLLNDFVRLSYGMASYACGDRLNPGNYVDPRSFRPLAVFDKEALLKGPPVEHASDVLNYRVPLRTVSSPDEDAVVPKNQHR